VISVPVNHIAITHDPTTERHNICATSSSPKVADTCHALNSKLSYHISGSRSESNEQSAFHVLAVICTMASSKAYERGRSLVAFESKGVVGLER